MGLEPAGVRELSTAGCIAASLGACFVAVMALRRLAPGKPPVDAGGAASLPSPA
jgi:hypothetical protein